MKEHHNALIRAVTVMKDTAKLARLFEETDNPATFTKNGMMLRCHVQCRLRPLSQQGRGATTQSQLDRLAVAEDERVEGKFADYGAATRELKAKYDL